MWVWLVNSFAVDFGEYLDNAECIIFELFPSKMVNKLAPKWSSSHFYESECPLYKVHGSFEREAEC